MKTRQVEAELLDTLDYADPVSARIHRDIHRYNCLLGHYRWIARTLAASRRSGDRILELGAGHGRLMSFLTQNGLLDGCDRVLALDAICPRPPQLDSAIEWATESVESFTDYRAFDVVLSCNFLHQLKPPALADLGSALHTTRLIIAAETARSASAVTLCRLSRLIGFSKAGIGDGTKSLRAGFRGSELFEQLGLNSQIWNETVRRTPLGAYHFEARRNQR